MIFGTCTGEVSGVSAGTLSPPNDEDVSPKVVKDEFDGWTEEQYKHYEDSILSKLYPPVIACKSEEIPSVSDMSKTSAMQIRKYAQNTHVPNTVNIDRSKAVGEISIKSGTSASGAKTYEIPINVYQGIRNLTPSISLSYNSQQGSSTLGMGWCISGISMIARGGKTVYYDGKTEGIKMDNSDSFELNGMRLIKTGTAGNVIQYESVQGNIKVNGVVSGTTMKYFEVYFPDGNKGIFGKVSNSQNQLFYPIISLKDLYGNTVSYEYLNSDNHYNISKISYNGCSVEFQYMSRQDPILSYSGGLKVYEPKLLKNIISK